MKEWFSLISFVVMVGVVASKIQDAAPGIDNVGWVILIGAFALLIFLTVRMSTLLVSKWPNMFTVGRAQILSITAIVLLTLLGLHLSWGAVGGLILAHFGEPLPGSR